MYRTKYISLLLGLCVALSVLFPALPVRADTPTPTPPGSASTPGLIPVENVDVIQEAVVTAPGTNHIYTFTGYDAISFKCFGASNNYATFLYVQVDGGSWEQVGNCNLGASATRRIQGHTFVVNIDLGPGSPESNITQVDIRAYNDVYRGVSQPYAGSSTLFYNDVQLMPYQYFILTVNSPASSIIAQCWNDGFLLTSTNGSSYGSSGACSQSVNHTFMPVVPPVYVALTNGQGQFATLTVPRLQIVADGLATPTPTPTATPTVTPTRTPTPTVQPPPSGYTSCMTFASVNTTTAGQYWVVDLSGDYYGSYFSVNWDFPEGSSVRLDLYFSAYGQSHAVRQISDSSYRMVLQHTNQLIFSSNDAGTGQDNNYKFTVSVCNAPTPTATLTATPVLFGTATPTLSGTPTVAPTWTPFPTFTPFPTLTYPPTWTPFPTWTPRPDCVSPVPNDPVCELIDLMKTQVAGSLPVQLPPSQPTSTVQPADVMNLVCEREPCYSTKQVIYALQNTLEVLSNINPVGCEAQVVDIEGNDKLPLSGSAVVQGICFFIAHTQQIRALTRGFSILLSVLMIFAFAMKQFQQAGDV